jgi:hypothetical protein
VSCSDDRRFSCGRGWSGSGSSSGVSGIQLLLLLNGIYVAGDVGALARDLKAGDQQCASPRRWRKCALTSTCSVRLVCSPELPGASRPTRMAVSGTSAPGTLLPKFGMVSMIVEAVVRITQRVGDRQPGGEIVLEARRGDVHVGGGAIRNQAIVRVARHRRRARHREMEYRRRDGCSPADADRRESTNRAARCPKASAGATPQRRLITSLRSATSDDSPIAFSRTALVAVIGRFRSAVARTDRCCRSSW